MRGSRLGRIRIGDLRMRRGGAPAIRVFYTVPGGTQRSNFFFAQPSSTRRGVSAAVIVKQVGPAAMMMTTTHRSQRNKAQPNKTAHHASTPDSFRDQETQSLCQCGEADTVR